MEGCSRQPSVYLDGSWNKIIEASIYKSQKRMGKTGSSELVGLTMTLVTGTRTWVENSCLLLILAFNAGIVEKNPEAKEKDKSVCGHR